MVIYTENPEKSAKQLQELSSKFRKASEYHVSIQKSVTYLYISSKQLENKIVKFLYNSTKTHKISRKKFNKKHMRSLQQQPWEKEEQNKWRDIPCSWVGGFNIVNMPVLPKLIYWVYVIQIKIPEDSFVEIGRLIFKFLWKFNRLQNSSVCPRMEECWRTLWFHDLL